MKHTRISFLLPLYVDSLFSSSSSSSSFATLFSLESIVGSIIDIRLDAREFLDVQFLNECYH